MDVVGFVGPVAYSAAGNETISSKICFQRRQRLARTRTVLRAIEKDVIVGDIPEESPDNDDDFEEIEVPEDEFDVVGKGGAPEKESQVLVLGDLDVDEESDEPKKWSQVIDVAAPEDGSILEDFFFEVLLESHDLQYTLTMDLDKPRPTKIQSAVVPWALEGRDIVICSHTGTGKTMAFLLPIIEQIEEDSDEVQAMIVAPTRELAMQISGECDKLIQRMDVRSMPLIGGANPARQIEKMKKNKPHIVVGTPGRLAELYESRKLKLSSVRMTVVDEVDQCLSQGFIDTLGSLMKRVSNSNQLIFASATADRVSVRNFALKWMKEPMLVRVEAERRMPKKVSHHYCVVPKRKRIETLRKIAFSQEEQVGSVIAFVDSQSNVDTAAEALSRMGADSVVSLRGDADKRERASVMQGFRNGKAKLLIATEIAARGLDLPEVSIVVNLDLPTDSDHYIHRAGRCGRAGAEGTVVSLTTKENAFVVSKLEKEMGVDIIHSTVYGGKIIRAEELPGEVRKRRELSNEAYRSKMAESRDSKPEGRTRTENKARPASPLVNKKKQKKKDRKKHDAEVTPKKQTERSAMYKQKLKEAYREKKKKEGEGARGQRQHSLTPNSKSGMTVVAWTTYLQMNG
uniref:RNA helicase n=1 Tax=Rhodosorus marinus TaxID=101924 RepID=A0A7S3E5X5_9RHOD|mmetsp:Transcript_1141/g.3202  ORF Transcript_1141/g.3202 Transcript_1141/m.3202 type:complete len:628 (+) Transcript_1141:151-2034(+)